MPATSISFRQVEVAPTGCDCTQRLAAVDRKIVDFTGTVDRVKGLERKIEEVCDANWHLLKEDADSLRAYVASRCSEESKKIEELERRTQYLEERLVETDFHFNKLAELERKMADLEVSPVSRKKDPAEPYPPHGAQTLHDFHSTTGRGSPTEVPSSRGTQEFGNDPIKNPRLYRCFACLMAAFCCLSCF